MKRLLALCLALFTLGVEAQVRLGHDVVPTAQGVSLSLDPRRDDYAGATAIAIQVRKPVTEFRFHAEDLTITRLALSKGGSDVPVTHEKGEDATVIVKSATALQPGAYDLRISFTNAFNRRAVGLYKMTTRDGEPYLYTQFEAIDARRAYPVWDEPHFKIPFQVTLTVPEQYDAVANTPVASETKNGETKIVRFAATKLLPSYLVAFAVGRFDSTPIEGMRVPGRVLAPKGQGHVSRTAAEITPAILAALEEYFDSPYPFEKVDLIAVPEYWAGAMENPGLITYRDTILLVDEKTASPAQKQNLVRVTAHELAHMWFGDLVTMEWWDDLWLNESFADWMGDKITDRVHPEYGTAIAEMEGIQEIMTGDARATVEAIRKPDASPEDAIRSVGLAYNKGKAVLSMFENWIGPEQFRQGVLTHIRANAWSNADAPEFFASLAKHAPAGAAKALATFIEQPGIPLVTAERTGPHTIRLSQQRFVTAGKAVPETWSIPVAIRYSDGTKTRTMTVLLDATSKEVKLEGKSIAWIFPHADAAGYYRWNVPAESMLDLARRAPDAMSARERLAFIANLGALFRAGFVHGPTYLEALSRFANDSDPNVVNAALDGLAEVRSAFAVGENRPLLPAYIRRTLAPVLERIGWTPRDGEPQQVTILRPRILGWLAENDDERVWQFVAEQRAKYEKDRSSVPSSLSAAIVRLSAMHGDTALFDEYRKRFESATLPAERSLYLSALGSFADLALQEKARDYALSDKVRANEMFGLLRPGETAEERDAAFEWATRRFQDIVQRMPPAFVPYLTSIGSGCEPERLERTRAFFADKKTPAVERSLERVAEQVNECAALRAREMKAVSAYLRKVPGD